jgi:hypothetical protein
MIEQVAANANDPQMTDFIEGEFLQEQVRIVSYISIFLRETYNNYVEL